MPELKVHQSSNIQASSFDPSTGVLTLQFVNGAIYQVPGYNQTDYDTFKQAGSPGTYFHAKIKPNYPVIPVSPGQTKSGRQATRKY
jgi:hypothetical protein